MTNLRIHKILTDLQQLGVRENKTSEKSYAKIILKNKTKKFN